MMGYRIFDSPFFKKTSYQMSIQNKKEISH